MQVITSLKLNKIISKGTQIMILVVIKIHFDLNIILSNKNYFYLSR